MTNVINWLKGKKTYMVGFAAAIYGAGVGLGVWPHMTWLDLTLGGVATVTMRAGIQKNQPTNPA
jgi:hypothetical protein